jgi:hypothetical protein
VVLPVSIQLIVRADDASRAVDVLGPE